VSAEARYYYVDAQNQAAGPVAMAALLVLKASGAVTDATLVVAEGGSEWIAFSALKPSASSAGPAPQTEAPVQTSSLPSSSSPGSEPLWASQLTQKIDQLTAAMDKLVVTLEKTRPTTPSVVMAPATAALHAEKINLNPTPKPGIAAQNPTGPATAPRPTPLPAGIPVTSPRPGVGTPLSPLAVPANAQKSPLPLPALGKAPAPTPAGIPKSTSPAPLAAPAKGNIFSKFLKK